MKDGLSEIFMFLFAAAVFVALVLGIVQLAISINPLFIFGLFGIVIAFVVFTMG